jgi:hypothetical protein
VERVVARGADRLARVVDVRSLTISAIEGTERLHPALTPEKSAHGSRFLGGGAFGRRSIEIPHDLAPGIDALWDGVDVAG